MFDISFAELMLIGAVALVVIGPEKLPRVARTAGMLFGRAQRMAAGFRADLDRQLHNAEIADLKKKLAEEAASFSDEMAESAAQVQGALREAENRILPAPPLPAGDQPGDQDGTAKDRADQTPAVTALPDSADNPARPRRRKADELQSDLFSEPPAKTDSTDWGDRR